MLSAMKNISFKISGICGILSPVSAFGFITAAILIHPWFRWPDHALSGLGALGTTHNFVYNLGLIVTGVLGLVFVLGLWNFFESQISYLGSGLFGVGLVFLILVGVFPGGTGPHVFVSGAFFGFCAFGMLVIGLNLLRKPEERTWGVFMLAVLILGGAILWLGSTISYPLGAAIPETIGAVIFSQFSIVFGLRLIGESNRA